MHSRKFRNGTKKWRKQHRKFHPNNFMWWGAFDEQTNIEFCKNLADKIEFNPGYIVTSEELKSIIYTDEE